MLPFNARFTASWLAAAILPTMVLAADGDTNLKADNPAYSWDLSDLYASPQAWTIEHDRILAQANTLDKYQNSLGRSAGAPKHSSPNLRRGTHQQPTSTRNA